MYQLYKIFLSVSFYFVFFNLPITARGYAQVHLFKKFRFRKYRNSLILLISLCE